MAIETLFDLLGWKFAREGDKANDFSKMFSAWGIQVNLTKFDQGIVEFANTPKRIEELVQTIETCLKTKKDDNQGITKAERKNAVRRQPTLWKGRSSLHARCHQSWILGWRTKNEL